MKKHFIEKWKLKIIFALFSFLSVTSVSASDYDTCVESMTNVPIYQNCHLIKINWEDYEPQGCQESFGRYSKNQIREICSADEIKRECIYDLLGLYNQLEYKTFFFVGWTELVDIGNSGNHIHSKINELVNRNLWAQRIKYDDAHFDPYNLTFLKIASDSVDQILNECRGVDSYYRNK